tara:strand:- start:93 stop:500 length:408 start_codon:yes stop_codon:yes gene_type:complete
MIFFFFFFFLQRRKRRRKRRRRAPLATTISTAAPKSPLLLHFSKAIAMYHGMYRRTRTTRTKLRSFSSYSFFFSTSLTAALTFLLHESFSPFSSHSFVSVFLSRVSILREDVKRFGRASFFFFSSSSFLVASLFL